MNERIQELAHQAGFNLIRENCYDMVSTMSVQEFAELIVRECMATMLKESTWYWDKDEFESSNAIQNAARRVKEHFGVESCTNESKNLLRNQ